MKILIISDIHGDAKALQDALNTPLEYDMLLLLGDHMYHGPRNPIVEGYNPAKVAEILNANNKPKIAVRGNCDSEVDQMLLEHKMMQDYALITLNDKFVYLTHGHLEGHEPKENIDIFLSGHTHLPSIETKGKTIISNPGSISLPKGGHPATYGYIDEDNIYVYTLEHEVYLSKELSQ